MLVYKDRSVSFFLIPLWDILHSCIIYILLLVYVCICVWWIPRRKILGQNVWQIFARLPSWEAAQVYNLIMRTSWKLLTLPRLNIYFTYILAHIHTYVYNSVYMTIHMCTCVFVCVSVYIYIHTHICTYTYTHIRAVDALVGPPKVKDLKCGSEHSFPWNFTLILFLK